MTHSRTDEGISSPQFQLADYWRANVKWSKTLDPTMLWRSENGSDVLIVRVNDFPEEPLYSLLVNGDEVGNFDGWPAQWERI
jgi:hypothetical protein